MNEYFLIQSLFDQKLSKLEILLENQTASQTLTFPFSEL